MKHLKHLRHLVIGAGNRGIKYASLLTHLGDTVTLTDLGFKTKDFKLKQFDSVFICTPPQTHYKFLQELLPLRIPIFCEKPVITNIIRKKINPKAISMVACNWRFCSCLKAKEVNNFNSIELSYPGDKKYGELDLAHFLDLFESLHGPALITAASNDHKHRCAKLILSKQGTPSRSLTATIWYDCQFRYTHLSDTFDHAAAHSIHPNGPCHEMELDQIKHWRNCIINKEESCNPITTAIERTERLIKALEDR